MAEVHEVPGTSSVDLLYRFFASLTSFVLSFIIFSVPFFGRP